MQRGNLIFFIVLGLIFLALLWYRIRGHVKEKGVRSLISIMIVRSGFGVLVIGCYFVIGWMLSLSNIPRRISAVGIIVSVVMLTSYLIYRKVKEDKKRKKSHHGKQ